MNAQTVERTDIYTNERASLREHLDILNGRTTWREPSGGHSTRTDSVPYEHSLSAALAFARDHCGSVRDIGPDVLEMMVYRRMGDYDTVERVITSIVSAVWELRCARLKFVDRHVLRKAAHGALAEVVTGVEAERPEGMKAAHWIIFAPLASRVLWGVAATTIRNAADSLR